MNDTSPYGSRNGGPLPADQHVHSEWSWDAFGGSMEATCERAVRLGLPAVAFTEHADLTPWTLEAGAAEGIPAAWRPLVAGGVLTPPPIDLDGYHECLERCRARHPTLRVVSGVELSEPHRHPERAAALLAVGGFARVLASVHSAPAPGGSGRTEVSSRFRDQSPAEVLRGYIADVALLVEEFDTFDVLAHIDFPVRSWPAGATPYDPWDFEDEHRRVLRALAASGKALEVNTKVPLHPQVLTWWHQEGGHAITFASDAHDPAALARGFPAAVRMAEAAGFRAARDPLDFWHRG